MKPVRLRLILVPAADVRGAESWLGPLKTCRDSGIYPWMPRQNTESLLLWAHATDGDSRPFLWLGPKSADDAQTMTLRHWLLDIIQESMQARHRHLAVQKDHEEAKETQGESKRRATGTTRARAEAPTALPPVAAMSHEGSPELPRRVVDKVVGNLQHLPDSWPLMRFDLMLHKSFSTCSRSLTTLIIIPATGMSILALSPNRVSRAVQMESLITPCAAKCSMGSQSCQWKGSVLLSVTIRRIQPNVCPAKASSSCLPLPSHSYQPLYTMYPGSLGFRSAMLIRLKLWTTDCAIQMGAKKCKLQILILIGLVLPICSVSS